MSWKEPILIKKAKQGDIDSFERLIEGIKGKAFQLAISYMKNHEDAEDVLQISFLKMFKHLNHFQENSTFHTWAYRIIVNTCMDEIKKNKKHKNHVFHSNGALNSEETILDIPDESFAPEAFIERNEKRKLILACLNKLPQKAREVIILRDMQGFSYEEIADILECSEGTIKSRISRGRQTLKASILSMMEQSESHFV